MIRSKAGTEIPTTLVEWSNPSRVALLIYDMQIGICRQVEGNEQIIQRICRLLEVARSTGIRVAFTRHLSLPQKWMGTTQLRTAMAWQRQESPDTIRPWFLRDAEATQIIPELAPREDEAVFDKLTMSAFDSSALSFALRDCGISAVAIAGIAMEIGIEPTVRQAPDHGFTPILIEDACGFGNSAASARSLETLKFIGDAIFTTTQEFCAAAQSATKATA